MRSTARRLGGIGAALISTLVLLDCTSSKTPLPGDPTPRPSDPYPIGPGCEAEPDPHCDNLINRAVIPLLRGSNLPIADESRSELCRRMALDLVGRVPSADEAAQCERESTAQSAERFMAMPDYLRTQRRSWVERFFELDDMWYHYIVEIDDLLEQLFRERISYADFMTQLFVHPGFYARFQGDDWGANVVRYGLGRPARADEIAGMRALQRVWDSRRFCDGIVWFNARADGATEREADGDCRRTEWAANFCNCTDGRGHSTCTTTVFGPTLDFGPGSCVVPDDRNDEQNLRRVTYVGAGRGGACPEGLPQPQCADRGYDDGGPSVPVSRLSGVSGSERDRLYSLGRLLATRDDFWEAAVDREMRHFLDWWQAGLRRPDFDLPEVRRLLAAELKRTGSVRQLHRTIVTSLLYAQPSELPPGAPQPPPPPAAQPPVWAFGPTRVMTSERWLDSVATVAYGEVPGVCDFRFVATNYDWRRLVNPALVMRAPAQTSFTRMYRDWAEALGGCSASRTRPVRSTLSIVSAQNEIARKFCGAGPRVLPERFNAGDTGDGSLDAASSHLYRRALGRAPSDEELTLARDEMHQCLAAGGESGCGNAEQAARWFCARLLDSAEFAIF